MFIRFQHLRVTPSFNLLEEFYTCFQSSFYDDNFCKNKLCFAVNSGQSIFPMIFDFGIFFIDVDTPLNLWSTKFLFVFFKRWEYLTIHFRIAHRVKEHLKQHDNIQVTRWAIRKWIVKYSHLLKKTNRNLVLRRLRGVSTSMKNIPKSKIIGNID